MFSLFFILYIKVSKEADITKDHKSGSNKMIVEFKKKESPAFPFWTKQSCDDSRRKTGDKQIIVLKYEN